MKRNELKGLKMKNSQKGSKISAKPVSQETRDANDSALAKVAVVPSFLGKITKGDFTFAGLSFQERIRALEKLEDQDDTNSELEDSLGADMGIKVAHIVRMMKSIGPDPVIEVLTDDLNNNTALSDKKRTGRIQSLYSATAPVLAKKLVEVLDCAESAKEVQAVFAAFDKAEKVAIVEDAVVEEDAVIITGTVVGDEYVANENDKGILEIPEVVGDDPTEDFSGLTEALPENEESTDENAVVGEGSDQLDVMTEDAEHLAEDAHASVIAELAGAVEEVSESEVKDFDEADYRETMIEALLEYEASEENKGAMRVIYSAMTSERLSEALQMMQKEWGGSSAFKTSLDAARELIEASDASAETKARLSVLNQKHADYHAIAQKVAQAIGNDTVINSMQHTAYHDMLGSMLKDYLALAAAVKHVAKLIRYPIPTSDDVKDSARHTANLQSMVKSLVYVGSTARSWLVTAETIRKDLIDSNEHVAKLQADLKRMKESYDHEKKRADDMHKAALASKFASFGSRLGLALPGGGLIGLNMPLSKGVKISRKDIIVTMELNRAILVESRSQVEKLEDALHIWAKKYPKSFDKLGINPKHLMTVSISIDKV